MTFELIIIALVAKYLRKTLNTAQSMPQWDKILLWMMYIAIGLFAAQFVSPVSKSIVQFLTDVILIGLTYVLYNDERFKQARFLAIAIIPYIIVSIFTSLVKLISPGLYSSWSGILSTANTFAVIWGVGSWWLTSRQQNELLKARKKAKEEEENNRIVSAMKAELEVQVAERTAELTKQKEELEHALHDLKSTQAQLIHSEKMASLGELTAGIAHEIQNPLNFVNNFSEVNTELIDELEQEINKGNFDDVKMITKDLKSNEQKILHHGKRADAIVKGMLQHSRISTGQNEPTEINALADEYLRLSYHGLRAKDKTFNAIIKADFDSSTGKINVVPQDMGRVLLNLFNNAFYAVGERRKAEGERYVPTVTVVTKKLNDKVEIKIADNGIGIPQKVADKIFQPFFTTKPTGQGTGLGLSLSYDIIKAHGGEIRVETKEGEGSEFIVQLPV